MVIVNSEDTRNSSWAKDKSGFGQRMLAKMGWSEGKGLGKREQGISTNLRGVRSSVIGDEMALGIGAKTDTNGEEGWEKTNSNYQSLLVSLRTQGKTSNEEPNEDEKNESGKRNKKKSKKKEKKKVKTNAKDEKKKQSGLVLAKNLVTAGHAKKMRESKDLTNKSTEDMAAIFGLTTQQFEKSSRYIKGKRSFESISPSENDKSNSLSSEGIDVQSKKSKRRKRRKET